MRLLLLVRDLDLGGAQRQLVHLAAGLVERGHHVVVANWHTGGALLGELQLRRIRVIELDSAWRGNLIGLAMQVRRLIRSEGIDITYSMMPVENLVGLLASIGSVTRLVWGIRTSRTALRYLPLGQRALFTLQRALARWPDAIIANSEPGAALVPGTRLGGKVVVIRNGTDTEQFRPNESLRESTRTRLKISSDALVISMVGRIEPQKGVEEFLAAIAELVKCEPRIVAIICGRTGERYAAVVDRLIRSLRLERHVRLVPQQPAVSSIYAATDVLASPSLGEGMSNVVAEAMASGLAVVATRVGENESLVGRAGWLVAPGNAEELQSGLAAAIRADRRAVGAGARSRVESICSVKQLVDQTETVLNRVLAQ
jgi:glycosyltransferase involved in cell wall biosynthesis